MIQRTVTGAEAWRGLYGALNEIECISHRFGELTPRARPAVIAAERVQPVPWVEVVTIRGRVKRRTPAGVTRTSVITSACEVSALDQRGTGAELEQPPAGRLHRARGRGPRDR